MTIESKFGIGGGLGNHFSDPWVMTPMTAVASNLDFYDAAQTLQTGDTVAFFTGIASYGVIDSTNWTANTYKTIFSHTGLGLVYFLVGPTAGGAETTTFEITIDGVKSEVTVTNASTERAVLAAAGPVTPGEYTVAAQGTKSADGGLDTGTLSTLKNGPVAMYLPPMRWYSQNGVPLLRYNVSCLIRMKHSTIITNSTATAYSGVMVRKGIAS